MFNPPPQPSYNQYMQSDAWLRRKSNYFSDNGSACLACGSYASIDLHHMTYDRLGVELDEDMVALCEPCHRQYHAIYEYASVADTQKFIAAKQAAVDGKAIFLKHRDLIMRIIRKAEVEHGPAALKLAATRKGQDNELLSYKARRDQAALAMTILAHFADIPSRAVTEIIRLENPDVGVFVHPSGMKESRGEEKAEAIRSSLPYRWAAEEIRARLLGNQHMTELQKLRNVLYAR